MMTCISISALLVCCTLLQSSSVTAYVPQQQQRRSGWSSLSLTTAERRTRSSLEAAPLTDRQLQFWEDVEDGLDDIANFWEKQGQSIDRIRMFGMR